MGGLQENPQQREEQAGQLSKHATGVEELQGYSNQAFSVAFAAASESLMDPEAASAVTSWEASLVALRTTLTALLASFSEHVGGKAATVGRFGESLGTTDTRTAAEIKSQERR